MIKKVMTLQTSKHKAIKLLRTHCTVERDSPLNMRDSPL
jgi:hypothetical protein